MSGAGAAGPLRFALVGSGYRAGMYLRLAHRLPHLLTLTGVLVRSAAAAAQVRERWGVPAHQDLDELLGPGPELVVTAVAPAAGPEATVRLAERGARVLAETPPAPDLQSLRLLWDRVGPGGLVQVAEQYLRAPHNAARRSVVQRGLIGTPTSVQVSSTQLHHAVSLVRGLLGAGSADARVTAVATTSPLADPLTRAGWTGDDAPRQLTTTLAVLDLGEGRSGLYDFTETQTRNPLRTRRLLVRGSRGELVDDRVVRLVDPLTVVESQLRRRQTGQHQDMEGMNLDHLSLDGEVLYRNPLRGPRLSDEEIAVTTLLLEARDWARGEGPAPYPLAEGAQDQLIALAIGEAVRTGRTVSTSREAWAHALG